MPSVQVQVNLRESLVRRRFHGGHASTAASDLSFRTPASVKHTTHIYPKPHLFHTTH